MTTGLVLIAAILVLGGVIATVGDRLGTRVGKARLSLFRLRPRQTATLITILTGALISASTLGILFVIDRRLRTGVFELEEIEHKLREAERTIEQTEAERQQTQRRLDTARQRQRIAQRRLSRTNQSLNEANQRQQETQTRLNAAQAQLAAIQTRFEQAQQLIQSASQQARVLQEEIRQLQRDRQELTRQRDAVREQIAERDEEIAVRDQAIAERERAIAERENQLAELERQQNFLAQEVELAKAELQGLRQGNVALLRNQVLVSRSVRIVDPAAAPEALNQILVEANQLIAQRIHEGTNLPNQQLLRLSNSQFERIAAQISDGQDYVVRVLSGGNYVRDEPCVLEGQDCIDVNVTAIANKLVFVKGEVIASTTVDPISMSDETLVERLNLLLTATQFRARQAGILPSSIQVADNRRETIADFFEQIKQHNQPLEIQAVAVEDAYISGPAKLQLIALQDGLVLFSTPAQ
jgi:uncharacterized protein (DUF3084 family)